MFQKFLLIILMLSLCNLTIASESVFKFNSGKATAHPAFDAKNRNYEFDLSRDGLKIDYPGKKRSILNISFKDFMTGKLSSYDKLILNVKNNSKKISPWINLHFRQGAKKPYVSRRIRANSDFPVIVNLRELAGKINLDKVDMLQIVGPVDKISILYKNIKLIKSDKIDTDYLVPQTYDLLKEVIENKTDFCFIGDGKIQNVDDGIYVHFNKWKKNADHWPNFTIYSGAKNGFNGGDISCWTHIRVGVKGNTNKDDVNCTLGVSIKDFNWRGPFWGIGSRTEEMQILEEPFYAHGFDKHNIRNLSFEYVNPKDDSGQLICKIEFVFKPNLISKQTIDSLKSLLKTELTTKNREQLSSTISELQKKLSKVQNKKNRYSDIQAFLKSLQTAKEKYQSISRNNSIEICKQQTGNGDFSLGIADSMSHVMLKDAALQMLPAKRIELSLARGEYESTQLVVITNDKILENVKVSISELSGPEQAVINPTVGLIGHSKTKRPEYPISYLGYYPNFIMEDQDSATLQANETTPFWIRFHAPAGNPAGIYKGKVTVSAPEKTVVLPVKVKVFDFIIPSGLPFPIATDFMNNCPIEKTYKLAYNSPERKKLFMELIDMTAQYKLPFDKLYSGPFTRYDYSTDNQFNNFNIWKQLKDKNLLKAFCLVNSTVSKSVNNPDDPIVLKHMERIDKHMKYWIPIAKKLGIYKYAYLYGFDEQVEGPVANKLFKQLKEYCPDLPVVMTGLSGDMSKRENVDILVPTTCTYIKHFEYVNKWRKKGKKVWWYVCNFPRPPHMTLMLDVPSTCPRLLMGMLTVKYRPDGFLYWSIIRWSILNGKPVGKGPRTDWNPRTYKNDNGAGNLFIPGQKSIYPTIRIENYRDGIEDYFYYQKLEKLMAQAKASKVNSKIIKQAQDLLKIPEEIVLNDYTYTQDPSLIRAEREKVGIMIEELKKIIPQ